MHKACAALLRNIVDYAGLFPPASLSFDPMIENYQRYRISAEAWLLNRLVLPANLLRVQEGWRVTLLVDREPGPLPYQVETLETKSSGRLSLPTYCEVPLEQVGDGFGKIRTAGPSIDAVADFISGAATMRKPFKATAGLHHAMRSGAMHGFVNVFAAATFAWFGASRDDVVAVLSEEDAASFQFSDDGLRWRDRTVRTAQIAAARREFAHSFGACSFEEPVEDLRELGWL